MFFGLQLALVSVFAVDNLIIARTLGAEVVPDYAVPYRMFAFVLTIVGFAVNPLWPAFGDAIADGDDSWVRRTLARAIRLTVAVASILAAVLVVTGNVLLGWWTNDAIAASTPLLAGLAVWVIAQGLASTISMFLNGAAIMRFQLITFWCMAVMAITLKVALVPSIGIAAAAWANAVAVIVCVIIPDAIYVPQLLRRVIRSRSTAPIS
jgi:O-antigen/teichoic acid export membrane protein